MNWWHRLLRTGRMEQELEAEIRFHFESQVQRDEVVQAEG